jgi:glutamyl-tRNA reductase
VTEDPNRRLAALIAHARHVSSDERAAFAEALTAAVPPGSLQLVTCHRVEAYVHATDPEIAALRRILPGGGRVLADDEAVRHVVSVAVGRDSVVLAEDEVLHQLRESLDAARAAGVDPTIERLTGVALRAGRRARSWQQSRRRSLGDVAIDAIRTRRTDRSIVGGHVVIVGAGKMGTLAAHAAVRAGATVTVANRTAARAHALAEAVGGRATSLHAVADVGRADGIVVALAGRWDASPETTRALAGADAVVVDLSFPPALDGPLATALGDRLFTADRLALDDVAAAEPERRLIPRLDALVEESARAFGDWLALRDARAVADALVRRADADRQRELEVLWRQLPALAPDARDAIEEMTRHLASRLLHEPLERLGRDPDGRDGSIIRDLFAL